MDMPPDLEKRYQYFTQADVGKLVKSGYTKSFTPLKEAVADYVGQLLDLGLLVVVGQQDGTPLLLQIQDFIGDSRGGKHGGDNFILAEPS